MGEHIDPQRSSCVLRELVATHLQLYFLESMSFAIGFRVEKNSCLISADAFSSAAAISSG